MPSRRPVSLEVIDERLRNMQEAQAERHKTVNDRIDDLKRKLDQGVVTRDEFTEFKKTTVSLIEFGPVKRIVYGLVGIILTGVVVAMLSLVVVKGSAP
jgi:hypothetical protein